MNVEVTESELSHWFSTYGVITAERILGKYQIKLVPTDLVMAIKSPFSFYHRLLAVPIKNVLNGIILQQASDYHIYVQKLFIDYLLSGESAKDEEAQGAITREALENERQMLVTRGEEFHKTHGNHDLTIATSQAVLIKITQTFNAELEKVIPSLRVMFKRAGFSNVKGIRKAVNHALIFCNMAESNEKKFIEKMNEVLKLSLTEDLKEKMQSNLSNLIQINTNLDGQISEFINETQDIGRLANAFRTEFFNTIIRVVELIKLLPEYKINPEQDAINREPLFFDNSIGAES